MRKMAEFDNRMAVIKFYRVFNGVSLREARDYVEEHGLWDEDIPEPDVLPPNKGTQDILGVVSPHTSVLVEIAREDVPARYEGDFRFTRFALVRNSAGVKCLAGYIALPTGGRWYRLG